MIRLAVAGATGRMGQSVLEVAAGDARFEIAAALTEPGCPLAGSTIRLGDHSLTIVEKLEADCDVLIDFTVAEGTMALLRTAVPRGMPMVIGATGHDAEQLRGIAEAAGTIPIVKASNFAVGVQAILGVLGRLVTELGDGYDVEIVETHHRHKIDAPSGTALTIVEEIRKARGRSPQFCPLTDDTEEGKPRGKVVFGRYGRTGERSPDEIGVHAIRMGETVGCHEIHFSGHGETVTIGHTAHSRETFAAGALLAAAWVVGKPPGLYSMREVMASPRGR